MLWFWLSFRRLNKQWQEGFLFLNQKEEQVGRRRRRRPRNSEFCSLQSLYKSFFFFVFFFNGEPGDQTQTPEKNDWRRSRDRLLTPSSYRYRSERSIETGILPWLTRLRRKLTMIAARAVAWWATGLTATTSRPVLPRARIRRGMAAAGPTWRGTWGWACCSRGSPSPPCSSTARPIPSSSSRCHTSAPRSVLSPLLSSSSSSCSVFFLFEFSFSFSLPFSCIWFACSIEVSCRWSRWHAREDRIWPYGKN